MKSITKLHHLFKIAKALVRFYKDNDVIPHRNEE